MSGGLVLDDVSAGRGAFLLAPVSLAVDRSETLFIAGPNGRGKSTLLSAIAGLLPLARGTIRFSDVVLATPARAIPPWRRPCALLLQELGLWPHLAIRKQCRLVARAGQRAWDPRTVDSRIASIAGALGITALLDRRPGELSGGEAQRCALLRALAPGEPLLLLDEPYSQQHEDGASHVDHAIETARNQGATIIVAGHRAPPGARRLEL